VNYLTFCDASTQRGSQWTGYKVHLTETCDEDAPHLVTHVETTLATTADGVVVEPIHAELKRKDCLPDQHLVDNGYGSGTALVQSGKDYRVDLFGPARPDVSWQASTEGAYDLSYFKIDFTARTVTCPQGHTTKHWYERTGSRGKPAISAQFPTTVCRACPVRERCTTAKA
jgi:transposase